MTQQEDDSDEPPAIDPRIDALSKYIESTKLPKAPKLITSQTPAAFQSCKQKDALKMAIQDPMAPYAFLQIKSTKYGASITWRSVIKAKRMCLQKDKYQRLSLSIRRKHWTNRLGEVSAADTRNRSCDG